MNFSGAVVLEKNILKDFPIKTLVKIVFHLVSQDQDFKNLFLQYIRKLLRFEIL
jgi:hypothetical protein